MKPTPHHRRARKGRVAVRAALVIGLAAAAGFIAFGGAQDMPTPGLASASSGWSLSIIAIL
jgi:hypothetical protein